jgi:hypothetical protein
MSESTLFYDEETKPHPKGPDGLPIPEPNRRDKNPASPTDDRLPYKKQKNDQVKLDFLGGYTGEKITEEDYVNAAKSIGCEVAVIKAVAEVETKAESFDKRNRPTILYERHQFSKRTKPKRKYDKDNPDISSRKHYKKASKDNKMLVAAGSLHDYDLYGNSYSKLAKAYSLDKNAALKACSWGKFQIMGFNHIAAGYKTIFSFVEDMCRSEKEHLKAFVNFVMANEVLRKAAIKKDWATFAENYNGEGYSENNYDNKMKKAYKRYVK